ncbi:unnamed protein product, partial [Closterium sp. NIES-53]
EPRCPTEPRRPAEPRRPTEPHCPARTAPAATAASAATAATAATAAMASPNVLTFDSEGRAVDIDMWRATPPLPLLPYLFPNLAALQPASPLPGPSPYSRPTRGLTERREPESRPASPESRHASPESSPETPVCARVPLPSPPASSLPDGPDPESDSLRAASPIVTRFLATVVTDPSFESTAPSALVAEHVDCVAAFCLDYATSLIAESESASVCPPSVGGECALGTDVLEDRQEDFECFAAALPHLVSMLLAPEGDPDAPDISTPRSYAEAIEGPYSSQWQTAMDTEMASWESTGTYVDEVPLPGANIVSGMWIFRLCRPPGFTGSFPSGTKWSLRRPVYGLRQAPREWHDTLRTTLAALGFAPSTADPSLFLRTDTTLPPFYVLVYVDDLVFATADTEALAHVKSELQKRHTWTDLGELTSYLGLRITRDRAQRTITFTQSHMVHQVLQQFGFTYSSPQSTPLPTGHLHSAPPSNESVEPSGPYPELMGCLMYLMTCTRPDLAYPLSILARYVTPGRHRKEHMDAAKRVLRYLWSTSGMGLVLGGRARVVLTSHVDSSWADDLTTQWSSQGYTFSLGSGSVSWRSTRWSSVLSSSCEAEIYAGAMAAQELRWLTYLLTDLGEPPRSPPVLYVNNKAMIALCREHRLKHRTKHIALRYFLTRELQQRGQLRLAYVATRANSADVFTKALQPCDHQRFCTVLGLPPAAGAAVGGRGSAALCCPAALRALRALLPCSPVRPAALFAPHALLSSCPARHARPAALCAPRALLPCSSVRPAALQPCAPCCPAAAATALAVAATALAAALRAPRALQPCCAPRALLPCCPVRPARPAVLLPCAPCAHCSPARPARPAALLPCAPCCPLHAPCTAPPPFLLHPLLQVQQWGEGMGVAAPRAALWGLLATPAALRTASCGPLAAPTALRAAPCCLACRPCCTACSPCSQRPALAAPRAAPCGTLAAPAAPRVAPCAFDHEDRPIQSDTWLDDLQLYLLSNSGAAPAPPATVDNATRSQAASTSGKRRSNKGKGGRVGGGGSGGGGGGSIGGGGGSGGGGGGGSGGGSGGLGGGVGGSDWGGGSGGSGSGGGRTGATQQGGSGSGQQQQQRRSETLSPQQLREWYSQGGAPGGSGSCPYVIRTGDRAGQTCGKPHTQHRCFSRLDDAWRAEFGDEAERPRWAELLRSGVAIFDLDYDAILAAMYALSVSAEGDCYLCVPPDLHIEAAPLGASESALPGTAPAKALHTFTLDSVLACSSTVLPCPAVPSSSLSGLHLPSFSTNLNLPWHHRLGHPSVPRLRGMHSRLLVSGLPRSLPPLPHSPAPPCLPCVEGRQRAAPHSSSFPPMIAPLQTLHMDVWGLVRVSGQGREHYFLLVFYNDTRYTTVFPLHSKGEVPDVLIPWIRAVRLQLRERFRQDLPILRLHSDRGGQLSSNLLWEFCRGEGILQSFTLPDSPQQNGIAECRIGLVMEVARTSMIHAAAPHFLWPFAVPYAAHQLNLWPRVSFRVWGSRAFVRDKSTDKLSACAIPCDFLGFPPDTPGWQFYHPTSRRVIPSQDVTFDKSVPFYHLFPYRSAPPPPPPLFLAPGPPPVDPLPPQGLAPSCVSQVDPLLGIVPVAVGSGAARGAVSGGAASGGAEPGGAESEGAGSGGAEPGGAEPAEPVGAEPGGAEPEGVEPGGAESEGADSGEPLSPQQLREWFAQRTSLQSGAAGAGVSAAGDNGVGGDGVTAGAGGTGGATAAGPGGARTWGTGAAGTGSVGGAGAGGAGAGDPVEPGGAGAGGTSAGGAGAGGARAGDTRAVGAGAECTGACGAGAGGAVCGNTGAGGTVRPRPYFITLLQKPESRPASPVCAVRTGRRVPRPRPPPFPDTYAMALRPSCVPLRVPLPLPPESSLPAVPDPECDLALAASPTVSRLLATVVTDPSFESTAASALVAELVDFAAASRLDYATALVAESDSASPSSLRGECAVGTDVLEDRQEDLECLAAAVPRFASMLLAPEGDPDAPDIPTPRSYAEAIMGPYSSQWQAAMDAEMASWKSTGTYINEVPPPGASIVDGMWIFRTFSPTPKMTTLQVLLHFGAQRDYELHSLDFSTAFLQGSLHEEIWLRRPPGFTGTTLAALGFASSTAYPSLFLRTDTSLPQFYVLVYVDDLVFATADTEALTLVKSELQKRHTCTDLGELRSYLGLQITRDRARRTITLTQSHMVHQVLQRFGFQFSSPQPTPLSTSHSLSAPPLDESVESSGPYPELVGCLITSGMGLVLGGKGPVVLTGHADASWVDDLATQRSSQGYTFSLGSGYVSWRSTRSSSVLISSSEAVIYAGATA